MQFVVLAPNRSDCYNRVLFYTIETKIITLCETPAYRCYNCKAFALPICTNPTIFCNTFKRKMPIVQAAFRRLLESGAYRADLFSDL